MWCRGARVIANTGQDVTAEFVQGAEHALTPARGGRHPRGRAEGRQPVVRMAGARSDGTFSKTRVPLPGVTTALLRQHGMQVFSEHELDAADACLRALDGVS